MPFSRSIERAKTACRILIADDNSAMRTQIRKLLDRDKNFEVCAEATNGLEAVKKVQVCHPDVAVLDVQMPVMNGLEATRRIKKLAPSLLVLLFPLFSSRELEHESEIAGADAILPKAEGSRLSGLIHFLLRRKKRGVAA